MSVNLPQRWFASAVCLFFVLVNLFAPAVSVAQRNARAVAQPKKVRLVVAIVIDQFRQDYLSRFEDQFVAGGFRRLLRDGAVFANAHYLHTPTVTACGHATLMTGATPALHGIVGNTWYERETGQSVTSVSDRNVKLLGGREGATGASPVKLIGSTLGDHLRLNTQGGAKVIGIALKDRSAILLAGARPTGAYWFDSSTGTFVSSTYYFEDLPEWVKQFNRECPASKYFGSKWEKLLPEKAYQRSLPDNYPHEKSIFGTIFPYTVNGGETKPGPRFYSQFEMSPFANDYTVAFAKAAIENEGLGEDDQTDLLAVSFSANDILGHYFGPFSQEVQDISLRTDRLLADFFSYLDKRVGLTHTIIVLTSDHGVSPIPEYAQEYNLGGRIEGGTITAAVNQALSRRFGDDKWILALNNWNIYFDYGTVARRQADRVEVERIACEALLKVPGIGDCFTRSQILSSQLPSTAIARSVANGFYGPRNGDVVIVSKPFYLAVEHLVANHGTPYGYDTHVPLIFYGAGIKAGTYLTACSPADIAPTLAALLKIEPPSNSVGRVLHEAISDTRAQTSEIRP